MSFVDTLKNPVVLASGVGLGLVLLMIARTNGADNNSKAVVPDYTSVGVAWNQAAMQNQQSNLDAYVGLQSAEINGTVQVTKAKIDATRDVTIANIGNRIQRDASIFAYLKNLNDNSAVVSRQNMVSNAGIINSAITQSAAITMDSNSMFTRMSLANTGLSSDIAKARGATAVGMADANSRTAIGLAQASASVAIAKEQASAVKKASKNNMFASIASTVGKLATAAL